jgi:hypothetical protein
MESNTYTSTSALAAACDTLDLIYSYIHDEFWEGCEQVLPDLLREAAGLLDAARPGMSAEGYAEGLRLLGLYRQEVAARL